MRGAWGDDSMYHTTVAEWVHRFKQGRTSFEMIHDWSSCNLKVLIKISEVIRTLIDENTHISIRYMVFDTGLS